jgi:hypothetical protein
MLRPSRRSKGGNGEAGDQAGSVRNASQTVKEAERAKAENNKTRSRQRELNTKRRGELAELAFTLNAATLGLGVSKPYGDSERYDVIVDPRSLIGQSESPAKYCRVDDGRPTSKARKQGRPKNRKTAEATGAAKKNATIHVGTAASAVRRSMFIGLQRASKNIASDQSTPANLWRVQIKCSTQLFQGSYRVNAHRRTQGRAVPYHPSEIDFIAAYVIPEDTWYIIPIEAVRGTSLMFRRKNDPRPGLYDQYREAWYLLRQN